MYKVYDKLSSTDNEEVCRSIGPAVSVEGSKGCSKVDVYNYIGILYVFASVMLLHNSVRNDTSEELLMR